MQPVAHGLTWNRSRVRRLRRIVALLACTAVLGACGGGDSDAGDGPEDGSGAPTSVTKARSTTTRAARPGSGGGDLEGTWTADAADVLSANLANLGGVPGGLTCSGPVTLTFTEETVTWSGEVTCRMGDAGIEATGSLRSEGSYRVEGAEIVVSGSRTSGGLSLAGRSIPVPAGISDGTVRYRIDGDTLSLSYADASVGTVTQRYTRGR